MANWIWRDEGFWGGAPSPLAGIRLEMPLIATLVKHMAKLIATHDGIEGVVRYIIIITLCNLITLLRSDFENDIIVL